MEKNFGPNSEQLPNAEFSTNDAAEDRRRGQTSQAEHVLSVIVLKVATCGHTIMDAAN